MTAGMVSGPSIVPLKLPNSGKKWMIDTETPIELHSDTPKTLLFYTLNGTKPDPFQKLGPKATYKFLEPFFLSPGKHIVKAIAILRDGSKESPVVTKTFQVEQAEQIQEDDIEEEHEEDSKDYYNKPWPVGQQNSFIESLMQNDDQRKPKQDQGPVKKALDSTIYNTENERMKTINGYLIANQYLQQSNEMFGKRSSFATGNAYQGMSSKTEALQEKCFQCGTLYSINSNASYCATCGAPLARPTGNTLPGEAGRTIICLNCHSSVPLHLPKCIVCEIPLHPEDKASQQSSTEKLLCLRCGTINPPCTSKCIVCEATLTSNKNNVVRSNAPAPEKGKYLTCSKCGRINSANARYCDWCGSKPQISSSVAICSNCKATNSVTSKYCSGCGKDIVPPGRPDTDFTTEDGRAIRMAPRGGKPLAITETVSWIDNAIPHSSVKPIMKNASTQTSGLFFPSSAAIEKELKAHVESMTIAEASRDRRVPISSISPGKGYWRQQLDHIFHHIKVYTQNNIDFRDSISNLKIGKIFAALAQEELDGRELMLTFSFSLKTDDKHSLRATARTVKSSLSVISALSESMSSKAESVKSSGTIKSTGSVKKRKKKKKSEGIRGAKKVTVESKMLLQKLSKPCTGSINSFIEELIGDGANPNHQDSEGSTPLKLAVKNGSIDCIPLLIDLGSDVNLHSGPKSTTALHEAVLLGLDGLEALQVLLDNGANTEVKSINGLTPYDMAVRSGIDSVMSKFASRIGKDVLNECGKQSLKA